MPGKIEARRIKGWQRMKWLDGITDLMDMSLGKLPELLWTGKPGVLQSMGLQRVGYNWATELKWTRLIIAFLPKSKCLLISCLQSPFAVILEPKKIKSVMVSVVPPWSGGTRCHDLSFLNVECKPTFSLYSFKFINRLFTSSLLSAIRVSSWTPYCQIQT